MRGLTLIRKCQEMVLSLMEYFEKDKANGSLLLPLLQLLEK